MRPTFVAAPKLADGLELLERHCRSQRQHSGSCAGLDIGERTYVATRMTGFSETGRYQ